MPRGSCSANNRLNRAAPQSRQVDMNLEVGLVERFLKRWR